MVGIRPSFRVAGPHCAIVTLDPTSIITLFFGAARPTFPSAALGPASSVLRRSVADLQRVGEYAPPSAPKPLVRSSVSVVRLPSNRPPRQSLATSTVTLGSQGFSAAGNKKKATSPRPKLGSIAEVRTDEEAANTTDGTISSDDAFVLPAITGVPHSPIVPKPVITTVTGGRPSRQHLLHSPYKAPSAAKRRVVRGGIAAASSRPPHGDDGSDALTVTGSGLPHVLLAKAVPP